MEPTSTDVEIENVKAFEFEFEEFTVYHENGIWWIDFLGDEDQEVTIIEHPESGIYFEEDSPLLEVGVTQEVFDRLKEVVHEKNS